MSLSRQASQTRGAIFSDEVSNNLHRNNADDLTLFLHLSTFLMAYATHMDLIWDSPQVGKLRPQTLP